MKKLEGTEQYDMSWCRRCKDEKILISWEVVYTSSASETDYWPVAAGIYE